QRDLGDAVGPPQQSHPLLDEVVVANAGPALEEGIVAEPPKVLAADDAGDMVSRVPDAVLELVLADPGGSGPAPQHDRPRADRPDVLPAIVGDPGVQHFRIPVRPLGARPRARVADGIAGPEAQEPGVATRPLYPASRPRESGIAGADRPVAQHGRESVLLEVRRRAPDDGGADRRGAVAVEVPLLRREHVGGVANDQAEALASHRLAH